MKLPRWLLMTMLLSSVVSALALGGWWWVTWPERTAREFLSLMSQGTIDDAKAMLAVEPCFRGTQYPIGRDEGSITWQISRCIAQPRTASDILYGRQRFKLTVVKGLDAAVINVERNKVAVELPTTRVFLMTYSQ